MNPDNFSSSLMETRASGDHQIEKYPTLLCSLAW